MFPAILRNLGHDKGHEKSVFTAFGYLNRAMRLPEDEFLNIPEDHIDDALNILNEHYEQAYGRTANTYNYHIISAHLKEIRGQGPLTKFTAYPFESSLSLIHI